MTHAEYLEKLRTAGENLQKDPVKLREFMKSIGAYKKRRVIDDPEEQEKIMTMLRLLGPGEQTNNQHTWTETWHVGNIEYNIHSGENFEELEEVIEDE